MVVVLLALPALRGDDKPKEKDNKSPKDQFQAVMTEFNAKRKDLLKSLEKAKGKERTDVIQKYMGVGKEPAEKAYKIAEDNPKDPAVADVGFFILRNGNGSDVYRKALEQPAGPVPG